MGIPYLNKHLLPNKQKESQLQHKQNMYMKTARKNDTDKVCTTD